MENISSHSIQNVIDNLHSAVVVIDQSLRVEYMNPSAEMLFQISDVRAAGRTLKDLVIEEYELIDRIERSLQSNHPFSMFDITLTVRTGQTLDLDFMASPIEFTRQAPSLLLEFISRGRHRKLADEEHLLKQSDASRSLLRGLAHEIKNPLGGLRGAAQLLERQLAEEDREYTSIIIREADRLQSLVDRMLGPRSVPHKTYLNIHKVLEHVRQLVQAENDAVQFVFDYDPSIPELYGDESMLIQAVLNITRNAVAEINDHDGVITFRTRPLRQYTLGKSTYPLVARIEIIDNGPGIPDDIKEKIFLPMITGHAEGTGLGLSIAQSLINQHDGLIECTSKPGKTVFTLLLPLKNGTSENHD